MILGIGVDLCRVERIRRSVARFGKAWLDEVFTDEEQARLGLGEEQAHVVAIGFALKEASAKTIGTGFARGARPQNFVVSIEDDRCSVQLTGAAKRIATRLCPPSTSPLLLSYYRRSEAWVSALVVMTLEGDTVCDLFGYLALSEVAARVVPSTSIVSSPSGPAD